MKDALLARSGFENGHWATWVRARSYVMMRGYMLSHRVLGWANPASDTLLRTSVHGSSDYTPQVVQFWLLRLCLENFGRSVRSDFAHCLQHVSRRHSHHHLKLLTLIAFDLSVANSLRSMRASMSFMMVSLSLPLTNTLVKTQ